MATYATQQDYEDYALDLGSVTDPATLERILEEAERDVDGLLGDQGHRPDAQLLKLVPADLTDRQRDGLTRAVCAQADYRIEMGPSFFRRAQHERVSGPQFSTSGQLPYIGPAVWRELRASGLVATGQWSMVAPASADTHRGALGLATRRVR